MPPLPNFADEPTQPVPAVARPDDAADDADDGLLEVGWEQPRRTSRLTLALLAALLVALGFGGGVAVVAPGDSTLGTCPAPPAGIQPAG